MADEVQYEWVELHDGRQRYQPVSPHKQGAKAEFWRGYHAMELEIGKHEAEKFEKHYASHGVQVKHRPSPGGGLEPVLTSRADYKRLLKARE